MLKQLSKYSIAGAFAAMINFGSRIAYEAIFKFNVSLVLAYFTGLLVNYCLSRQYVFAEARVAKKRKQYPVFVAVASAGLVVTYLSTVAGLAMLNLMVQLDAEMAKSCAHLFGIGCGFLANFYGHKTITFKRHAT